MHHPLLLLPLLLITYTVGGVRSSSIQGRSWRQVQDVAEWPGTGISLCQKLQEPHYRQKCIQCFTKARNTMKEVKVCVKKWLPGAIAKCATSGQANSIKVFNNCIALKISYFNRINKRAELLYKKGGAVLKKITDSKILENGSSAVFSIIAQELLINTEPLKSTLNATDNDCLKRFQVNSANEHWHLHPSEKPPIRTNTHTNIQAFQKTKTTDHQPGARNLVYDYGLMGHQMPFHGIGPLAVDILKGICLMHYLEDTMSLQAFIDMSVSTSHSMPAWLFQESLNKISSITLPTRAPSA